MHKEFARTLRRYEGYNKLNCVFWSYDSSGENRNAITGALLKAKGLRPGQADYCFKFIRHQIAHYIHIEFKTPTNSQSPHQILFEATCTAANDKYYIARSVKDALDILEREKIIR